MSINQLKSIQTLDQMNQALETAQASVGMLGGRSYIIQIPDEKKGTSKKVEVPMKDLVDQLGKLAKKEANMEKALNQIRGLKKGGAKDFQIPEKSIKKGFHLEKSKSEIAAEKQKGLISDPSAKEKIAKAELKLLTLDVAGDVKLKTTSFVVQFLTAIRRIFGNMGMTTHSKALMRLRDKYCGRTPLPENIKQIEKSMLKFLGKEKILLENISEKIRGSKNISKQEEREIKAHIKNSLIHLTKVAGIKVGEILDLEPDQFRTLLFDLIKKDFKMGVAFTMLLGEYAREHNKTEVLSKFDSVIFEGIMVVPQRMRILEEIGKGVIRAQATKVEQPVI